MFYMKVYEALLNVTICTIRALDTSGEYASMQFILLLFTSLQSV